MTKLLEDNRRVFLLNVVFGILSQLIAVFWLSKFNVRTIPFTVTLTFLFLTGAFAMARTAMNGSSKLSRLYKGVAIPLGIIWQVFALTLSLLVLVNLLLGIRAEWLLYTALSLSFLYWFLGGIWSICPKQVNETIRLKGLPIAFEGLRIMVLADIHAGVKLLKASHKKVRRLITEANPDLVVLVGDIVDYDWSHGLKVIRFLLQDLNPPLGIFGVVGNHDVYGNLAKLLKSIQDTNLCILLNESVALSNNGEEISLVGITDPTAGAVGLGPEPEKAFSAVPEDAFVIALSHRPEAFLWLETYGPDLVVAGHTHGKHRNVIIGSHKYSHGPYERKGRFLYVSGGIGNIGITRRFLNRSEVSILTLKEGS